ncbi:alpha/beta hydrolase [Pseudorhizobium marinum]|uniref:alpha/beta hydrolase n=1 Tax=Pseudorhizobium marinum TaxID=1496690 RepID=UPI0004982692|nr:alpha/beta hydrolase [Pseudorhizobium marinum]
MRHRITDWDDAYANGPNIAGGERWPGLWIEPARMYRQAKLEAGQAKLGIPYGEGERNKLDLFLPAGEPRGLVVFVHGGFWLRLDRSYWSHLARGPVEAGFAVAMPSYTLCPDIRISGITAEVGAAIEKAAELVEGPVRLIGHSAGGHLVTRMITTTSPLPQEVQARVAHTVSLSGVHDLRPLMHTAMNAQLNIDRQEAWRESPALLEPMNGARLTCWVGATERSEFLRQNALLANLWKGLGAETEAVEEPDRHHFNVLDGLANPNHPLTQTLLS